MIRRGYQPEQRGTGKKSEAIKRAHDASRRLFPSGVGVSTGPLGTTVNIPAGKPNENRSTLTWLA